MDWQKLLTDQWQGCDLPHLIESIEQKEFGIMKIGDKVVVIQDLGGNDAYVGIEGVLEMIDEHNEDGDFYGVRLKHDNSLLFFWMEELQVI